MFRWIKREWPLVFLVATYIVMVSVLWWPR